MEREWEKVVAVEPRPGALVFIRDLDAQKCLLWLRSVAQQCRNRCLECLRSGDAMGEEEAGDFVEAAGEALAKILDWMEQALRREVGG